ncbi:MAG: heavy-metal-associated domain-containing protein [Pseudaminobacter sp.]|nr:heavy-metal-associated domain-containing protein [Pseudaminobacter sp.]
MKRPILLAAAAIVLSNFYFALPFPGPTFAQTTESEAASQSATFAIQNMTCALCPVTVKNAMEGVDGVQSVDVDFDAKTATVIFDPSATTPDAIAAASANAGYPAAAKG